MSQAKELEKEILEGIEAGLTIGEIATALGRTSRDTRAVVHNVTYALVKRGTLRRLGEGRYEITKPISRQPQGSPARSNGHARITDDLVESDRQQVEVPLFMRSRDPVVLFVERSPVEVESVIRFELQIGGIWLPVPLSGDMRICVGADIPRWSPAQEIYNGVTSFRITYQSGDQRDYSHNPQLPITVVAR